MSAAGLAIVDCLSCFGEMESPPVSIASTGSIARKAFACASGKPGVVLLARVPILVEAKANARWSLDFVHDQFACGRRFRILNVVDDVTRECLAAIPDTSI